MDQPRTTESIRLELHNELVKVTNNCYYSPIESFRMSYPCIVYKDAEVADYYADNVVYITYRSYIVTVISKNPVEAANLHDEIRNRFKYSKTQTTYVMDNLYHKVIYIEL